MIPYDYSIVAMHNDEHVSLQLEGRYQQQAVTWHAELYTLRYYYQHQSDRSHTSNKGMKQFIEIDDSDTDKLKICIALNVQKIDKPTILKTVVMINQYRRLHAGKHEYGPAVLINE